MINKGEENIFNCTTQSHRISVKIQSKLLIKKVLKPRDSKWPGENYTRWLCHYEDHNSNFQALANCLNITSFWEAVISLYSAFSSLNKCTAFNLRLQISKIPIWFCINFLRCRAPLPEFVQQAIFTLKDCIYIHVLFYSHACTSLSSPSRGI